MPTAPHNGNRTVTDSLAAAVDAYREHGSIADLLDDIARVARGADASELAAAVEPFISIPEVAGPVYERILDLRPDDARAMVILANAYWLSGRGPDVVGELATRAIAADPDNRGAWHLWALSESDQRERTGRWMQVTSRFPTDDLARANLADNAASLAGAEQDREALGIAIASYEALLSTATHAAQREALGKALTTLRGWKL